MDFNQEDYGSSPFQSFVPRILKTKAISLSPSPCSENANIMWNPVQNPVDNPELPLPTSQETATSLEMPISQLTSNTSSSKKDKSPLEATFTHPNEPLDEKLLLEKQKQRKNTADYTALEFISSSSQANSLTLSINADDKQLTRDRVLEDEKISTALVVFFVSVFSPLWSLGMAYWYFLDGDLTVPLISVVIFGLSTLSVHLAYFSAKSSPKKDIWKSSKLVSLLCVLPGLPAIILSFCNVVFAIRESRCRSYERPWSNTRFVYLVESLALAFPQSVLHLLLLSEDPDLIHSLKGYVTILGIGIFSFTLTVARFRYDTQDRYERFGNGVEKYIRFTYMWANKVMWVVTYSLVIISLRLALPLQKTTTTIGGIGLLLALLEVPILMSMIPAFTRVAQSMLGLLMMIPQFVALSALIVWVNVDPNVYNNDNGCFILGLFFYAEAITLTGWLYDRCTGREIDFLPVFPHFFGDLMTTLTE